MQSKIIMIALILVSMSCRSYESYVSKGLIKKSDSWLILYNDNSFEMLDVGIYGSGKLNDINDNMKYLESEFTSYSQLSLIKFRILDTSSSYWIRVMYTGASSPTILNRKSDLNFSRTRDREENGFDYFYVNDCNQKDSFYFKFGPFLSESFVLDTFCTEVYPILPKSINYDIFINNSIIKWQGKREIELITKNFLLNDTQRKYIYHKKRLSKKMYKRLILSSK